MKDIKRTCKKKLGLLSALRNKDKENKKWQCNIRNKNMKRN